MNLGLFELFFISTGPSGSHTLAPMRAGAQFLEELTSTDMLHSIEQVNIEFFGSLALIGKKQHADTSCLIGLMGLTQSDLQPSKREQIQADIAKSKVLKLNEQRHIVFDFEKNVHFHTNDPSNQHSNAIRISVTGSNGDLLRSRIYHCIGPGLALDTNNPQQKQSVTLPYPFFSMAELTHLCTSHQKSIAELVFENEIARTKIDDPLAAKAFIFDQLDSLWITIKSSIEQGVQSHGELPSGLHVERRAAYLHEMIKARIAQNQVIENDHWVNLFAMATSEESAAGGTIVGVPSSGAAGVIAAVLAYYNKFVTNEDADGLRIFMATAAAVGALYKGEPSLQSAQLGCQGEIGVACSMAAAGLTAAKKGSLAQIENAAKIAMEHNIGLSCDPIGGLVQVPCIERNCMGAVKAINASRLAMTSAACTAVNLDEMIKEMHQSALNMNTQYKETSLGDASKNRISVNVVYC